MIYMPAEDSYALNEVLKKEIPKLLKKNPNIKFLEIGAGSGIHLLTAEKLGIKKENIFSSDIDEKSVTHCNLLGYNCLKSNLFENIKGKYDLIIFNPPYLPEESYDKQQDTSGGKKGDEIIISFLKNAKNYLNNKGKILLLTSSLTPKISFKKLGYNFKKISSEKLFYEQLFIWNLAPLTFF